MGLKRRAVVFAGIMGIVVTLLLIRLSVIPTVEKYRVVDLVVASPGATGVGDWRKTDDNETELIFAVSTENDTFVIQESIVVRHEEDVAAVPDEGGSRHLSPGKAKVAGVVGFMLQRFLQEGYEVGEASSFAEVAAADAYRFELVRREVPTEYILHIVIWKEDWYLITYTSNTASPGPHISDFEALLEELEFV